MNTAYIDNVTNGNADRNRLINGQADLLQCFATVEGNVAVRQRDGSPFIKELCSLLKERVSWISKIISFFHNLHCIFQKSIKLIGWENCNPY